MSVCLSADLRSSEGGCWEFGSVSFQANCETDSRFDLAEISLGWQRINHPTHPIKQSGLAAQLRGCEAGIACDCGIDLQSHLALSTRAKIEVTKGRSNFANVGSGYRTTVPKFTDEKPSWAVPYITA